MALPDVRDQYRILTTVEETIKGFTFQNLLHYEPAEDIQSLRDT